MPDKIFEKIEDLFQQYLMKKINRNTFETRLQSTLSNLQLVTGKKEFKIAIVNEKGKEPFFGFRLFPEQNELDSITNDMINNRISFRELYTKWSNIKSWYLEIDNNALSSMEIRFNPKELTAMLLHEIGHIVYSEKFVSVTYNCFKESQGRIKISDKGSLKILYSLYSIPLAIACMQRHIAPSKQSLREEFFADKYLVKYGYTESLLSALEKITKSYGNNSQIEANNIHDLETSIKWCDLNTADLAKRKDNLKDELFYQSLKSESNYFKSMCFILLNKIGFKMRERYNGAVVEATMDMLDSDSRYGKDMVPVIEFYEPIADIKVFNKLVSACEMCKRANIYSDYESAMEGLFGSRNRKKRVSLPNQHEIDEIEIEISRITNHSDKLFVLDLIYDLLDRIQIYEEYNPDIIESRRESGKIATMRDNLDRLRKAVLAKNIDKKKYKVFVEVPEGYEG